MTVAFNTIPADLRVPLFYGEIDHSQANSASGSANRRLMIAQVNDDAVLTEPALTMMSRSSDAITLGGEGSMLAAMHTVWRRIDPMGELWCLPTKVTTGQFAVGKIAIEGAPTEAGVLNLYIGATRVRVAVALSQSAHDTATALVAAINATPGLPVIASVNDTLVTLCCRWKGATGNDIRLTLNLKGIAANERTPAGLTVTLTQPTGGEGSPDMAALLASIGDEPFEFICQPYSDSTSLDHFRDWMSSSAGRWSYAQQLYGHVYGARRGTLGELVAAGRARNDEHMTIGGVEANAPDPIWLWAAAFAARQAVFISADPARPTQTGELTGLLPAPPGQRFILSERQALLMNGMASHVFDGSMLRIERAITTYQRNAYGQPDDSYLDSETMHTTGYIMRFLRNIITSKYGRHKLANDGTRFGAGDAIVTPAIIRGELTAAYYALERQGMVENADLVAKYLIVERDKANPNRLNVLFPPDYVNQLRIFALVNQFRGEYGVGA